MPPLVLDIIFDQKSQRYRRVLIQSALRPQPVFRDMIHHCNQDLVFRLPPRQQHCPCLFGISMGRDPFILPIVWPKVRAACRSPHKPLPVVRRRVEQVAHNLFSRPPALTLRHIGQRLRQRNQSPMHLIQIGSKLPRNLGHALSSHHEMGAPGPWHLGTGEARS